MGLNCSHDAWSGSYVQFNLWRKAVARAAGYEVKPVDYQDTFFKYKLDTIMLDWEKFTPENLLGEWGQTPEDPLVVIFAHSDCEGKIFSDQAMPLADALEEMIPKLEPGGSMDIVGQTERFVNGLREAARRGEPIEFL